MIKAWALLASSIGAIVLYVAETKYYSLYQFKPSHEILIISIATTLFIVSALFFFIVFNYSSKKKLEKEIITSINKEDLLQLSIAIECYIESKHFNRATLILFNFEAQKQGKTQCVKILSSAVLKTHDHHTKKQ